MSGGSDPLDTGLRAARSTKRGSGTQYNHDNQEGGNPTPQPWSWYNSPSGVPMNTQHVDANNIMPQLRFETHGPSGNNPHLIGGAKGAKNIKQMIEDGASLKELGDGILVVTEENRKALFDYIYQANSQLKEKFGDVLERAEEANAFIWNEMKDSPIGFVIEAVNSRLSDFIEYEKSEQSGGNPTPQPWSWYNSPDGVPMNTQHVDANNIMPQLRFQTAGPSGNNPNLVGGSKNRRRRK
jgi:hypothetical protein